MKALIRVSLVSRTSIQMMTHLPTWSSVALMALTACSEGNASRTRPSSTPSSSSPPDTVDTSTPDAEPVPPGWSLPAGARYFEREGVQAPIFMRNVSAPTVEAFTPLFAAASDAGTRVVRLQITQGFGYQTLGMSNDGGVLSSWATSWDAVIDEAERAGLGVIVVFTLWGDWNDGTPALGWSHYDANPLSSARGGPAASPADLFADTEAQRVWLGWLSRLIGRWSSRPNVIAWEIFSEVDLATGATQASATDFVEKAHAVVREIDPWRPAFASTSDLPLISYEPWQAFWDSPGNDLVSVHPYAAELDRVASERVRTVLGMTTKPVLVGESGLDAAAPSGATLTSSARASVGLEHAIWAELVSGSASARALYWEDGYAAYYPATGLPLVTRQHELEREAARWLAGKDFRELVPVGLSAEPPLFGVALTSGTRISGWARNEQLAPPDWSAGPLAGAVLQVPVVSETSDAAWTVTLTSPEDGAVSEVAGTSRSGYLSFEVEGPFESVAFDARRDEDIPPLPEICPVPSAGACVGPIYSLVLDGVSLFADPECPTVRVAVHSTQCNGGRSATLASCLSDEVTERRSCVDLYISDPDGSPSGTGTYYDAVGAAFDVVITEAELALEGADQEEIRAGALRGTLSPSGAVGTAQPFELTFSACTYPTSGCLR